MATPRGLEWESDRLAAELRPKPNHFKETRNLTWALFFLFFSLLLGSRVVLHSFPSISLIEDWVVVPGYVFAFLGGIAALVLFTLALLGLYRYYDVKYYLHSLKLPPPPPPQAQQDSTPYRRADAYASPVATRYASPPPSYAVYDTPNTDQSGFRSPYPAPNHGTPQYAPSYRESPAKSASGRFSIEDKRSDEECKEAFANLKHELGIGDKIHSWAQNMKIWLAESLVGNIVAEFTRNERELDILAQDAVKRFANMMSAQQRALALSQEPEKQEERLRLFMSDPTYQTQPAILRWPSLQKYLQVPTGYQSTVVNRGYVLQRLKALGKGYGLREYSMEMKEGPSDAQIVMHCFLTFFEDHFPNFTQMYFHDLATDRKRGIKTRLRGVSIVQTRSHPDPPYFVLMVQGASEEEEITWRVEPGRNNLFSALALFVYYVNSRLRGKLQHLKLSDPALHNVASILIE